MGQKSAAYNEKREIVAFYDSAISPAPNGVPVIEITADQHAMLLSGQATGKRMAVDEAGAPVLLDPAPPSDDDVASTLRASRDTALTSTDWLVMRHTDELQLGNGTTLTADQYTTLLTYRKTLRDLPTSAGWPYIELPAEPDFVTAIA
jgi:hypothetical protein